MKIFARSALAITVFGAGLSLMAPAAFAADLGGWSEDQGTTQSGYATAAAQSTPNHRGQAEEKDINGTTNKRAHGWTTWAGVYHYTTAQLETYTTGKVVATSGRKWGTGGTEAISPWKPYTPDSPGKAATYYGR